MTTVTVGYNLLTAQGQTLQTQGQPAKIAQADPPKIAQGQSPKIAQGQPPKIAQGHSSNIDSGEPRRIIMGDTLHAGKSPISGFQGQPPKIVQEQILKAQGQQHVNEALRNHNFSFSALNNFNNAEANKGENRLFLKM